jgi:hypothetical protein
MKILLLLTLLFSLISFPTNYAFSQDTSATYQDRKEAEKNSAPFNPASLYSGENRHVAVFFDVVDGDLVLSDRGAMVMYGNMPYKSKTGGSFIVIAEDREGKEVLRYYTADIRLVRAFDGVRKESAFIENARDLFIQIPYDQDIHQLEIGSTLKEGDLKTYDISRALKAIF